MKSVELIKLSHNFKIGDKCSDIVPNITEDTLFTEGGVVIGFYIRDISKYPKNASLLAKIADKEFRSTRVPKSEMSRGPQGNKLDKLKREKEGKNLVTQYSTILGGVPPKPHMRRDYPTVSSVHSVPSARDFVRAMLMLSKESAEIIKEICPHIYHEQKMIIEENCPEKYRFGDLFTSSISNFNIAADYHIDNANLKGCVNVIIAKRKSSTGGNTTVPDYGATVDSCDNSMLVYPAWKNLHGVTPIKQTSAGGYRNTLVFYPLKSFKGLK